MKKNIIWGLLFFCIFNNYSILNSKDTINEKDKILVNKEIKKYLKKNNYIEEKSQRQYFLFDIDNDSIKDLLVLFIVDSKDPGYRGRNTCSQNLVLFKKTSKTLELLEYIEDIGGCGYAQGLASFVQSDSVCVLIDLEYYYENNRTERKAIGYINGKLKIRDLK